jgi:hypothetical protein
MSELVAGTDVAYWTATATEGVYRFQVTRADDTPIDPDRLAWHWHLQFSPTTDGDDGQNVHVRSTTADVIWAPAQHDSVRVLASLASFLSAWDEAIRYAENEENDAENRRLFPDAALPVLGAVEQFTLDMYVAEVLTAVPGNSPELIAWIVTRMDTASRDSGAQSAQ